MRNVCLNHFLIAFTLLFLTRCTKGDGGGSINPSPNPTLALTAAIDTVWYGGSTILSWSSTNATEVRLQGGPAVTTTGSLTTPSLLSQTPYSFIATGPGGSITKSKTIMVWSQKRTFLCNNLGSRMTYCKSAGADSTWHDGPMDPNTYQFFPNGSGQINSGPIVPNVFSLQDETSDNTYLVSFSDSWHVDFINEVYFQRSQIKNGSRTVQKFTFIH